MERNMTLNPIIAIHMTAALLAIATGPVALWARKGRQQRPRLHRAFGYAWVTLMLVAAISAIFIKAGAGPSWNGFGIIHLLVPVTLFGLFGAFWFLYKGNINGHRKTMQRLYIGACLVAGGFTLLPGRYLGDLVFKQWLGVV
jgi:uncharacterized membrane protein